MRTELFDYSLPKELIAQTPIPRGESRLLVLHRDSGRIEHRRFPDLLSYLSARDTLVLNDTRVIARLLEARRGSGEPAEALLLRPRGEREWEALIRPGRRVRPGSRIRLLVGQDECVEALITGTTPEGGRVLQFADSATRDRLAHEGSAPLPPYIHVKLQDEERYQTVYGTASGSAAAPTAGLHFTPEILSRIESSGVGICGLTLHVSVDTFRPVRTEEIESHVMHGEWFSISESAAQRINSSEGRIIAVGTTVARALETAATCEDRVRPMQDETKLFIAPGYKFKVVQGLLTNFHLPKSTLLMLISAFAGRERVLEAYREAVEQRYRFYSFGDAMLII